MVLEAEEAVEEVVEVVDGDVGCFSVKEQLHDSHHCFTV